MASISERSRRRPPAPPFTTSTLQQEAFRRLRFGVKKTMQVAQRLYEGVELGDEGAAGLITYMRTDSTRVAPEAADAAREYVARVFGPEYVPATRNEFPSARGAQGAHEAIRPTDLARTPEALGGRLGREELALYALVFERFLASQMAAADYDDTLVDVAADPPGAPPGPPAFGLRARGSVLRFRGFLALHEESADEDAPRDGTTPLPPLRAGQELALVKVEPEQRFSEPPPRFSEASLVKELERCGVGRPSTYAGILATLLDRHYVEKAKGRLAPTPLGFSVTDLLVARFPDLLSVGYTAGMEEGLDAIEDGRATLIGTLGEFWRRFSAALEAARREPAPARPLPAAGAGAGTARPAAAGVACPLCHEGCVVPRRSAREGRSFFGCSRFPACRFTSTHPPLAESCPECGEACLYEKDTRRDGRVVFCGNPACHYHRSV